MELKLTKADKIILKSLAYNSRILEKELAKKCYLSKDSIRYRINRLEKLKVIRGYGAFVDYTVLGLNSYKLYLRSKASIKQKEELKEFLRKQKSVFAIMEAHGNWDISIVVFTKNRSDYAIFEKMLLSKFGKLITSRKFCLMLDGIILNNKSIFDSPVEEFSFWKGGHEKLDDVDRILVNEIHNNGRETLVNLASKVNLSVNSVSKRIKKLEEKKVISFYTTDIDYNLLGFEKYKLFIYVEDYSEETEEELFNFLKNKKSTINIIKTLGPWQLEIEFLVKEHDEVEKILSEMQEKFPKFVQKLEFSIFRKETMFPGEKLLD